MLKVMAEDEVLLIGRRIKLARERLGIAQADLGQALGVAQQAIDRWEKGKTDLRGVAVRKLADALEVTTDYLLGASDEFGENAERSGLSKEQRQVLWFMDNGLIVEAVKALTDLPKRSDAN